MELSPVFYGLMGAGSALFLSSIGAAIGTAKSANYKTTSQVQATSLKEFVSNEQQYSQLSQDPIEENIQYEGSNKHGWKFIVPFIPIIIAGVLSIYGLIYSVIVLQAVTAEDYSASRGYAQFVGGVTLGICCLASGIAVGAVGKKALTTISESRSSVMQMALNLVYCEALGLYGLIFGLIAASAF